MAKLFWGQIPIERATAFFYYEAHADAANIIYELKYKNHPEIGEEVGRMFAKEIKPSGFFDGIDGIVPVPLAKKRLRQRGYNPRVRRLPVGWLLSLICQYSIRLSGAFSLKVVKPAKGDGTAMKTWKMSLNLSKQILSEASISYLLMMWLLQELPSLPVLKNSVRLVVSVSASSHLASPRADKWNRQVVRGKSQTLDGSILNVI